MKHLYQATALAVATTMLAGTAGCAGQETNLSEGASESNTPKESAAEETTAQLNADGNYNIF